eukprot:scaffold34991_cov42-Phaeocystis_antarctica.AAC.1
MQGVAEMHTGEGVHGGSAAASQGEWRGSSSEGEGVWAHRAIASGPMLPLPPELIATLPSRPGRCLLVDIAGSLAS